MSYATDVESTSTINRVSKSQDPTPNEGAREPRCPGDDILRCDGDRDNPSTAMPFPNKEEISLTKATRYTMLGASTPLCAAGAAILLVIAVSSPLVSPAPVGWFRSGTALIALLILSLFWRHSQKHSLTAPQSDFLQILLVFAATGLCVVTQLWNPSSEVAHGFVIAPLVLSLVFRSVGISIVANVMIAAAWAVTWHSCGLAFNGQALLTHLYIVPVLSIAISITQQSALRELADFQVNQHHRIQERHDVMQLVAEEASLRAKSEAELRRHHSLLELILATVPDRIFVKDRQRRVLVANRSYLEGLKLKKEDLLGKSTDEVIPKNMVEISRETDMAVLRDGLHIRHEAAAIYDDGNERVFEIEKMPLIENDEITGIVGIARDVTERRVTEERLKEHEILLLHASRLSSMGELVAGIAHEINQPLYSILNYAKAVTNTLEGPREPNLEDVANWAGQILKEATRGGVITKRLRSFVRRTETQCEQASLTAIVRESIDFIAGEARSANVKIQSELEEKLPEVHVDRVQIQQVLVNLMKNAIEALQVQDTNSRNITISTRRVPAGVEVAVADNGPGIPAGQTSDLVEPFFTTKKEGVGLGLAISNTIIEAHEGELSCKTNEWGGATFYFTLGSAQNRFEWGGL